MLFPLGRIVITRNALSTLLSDGWLDGVARHSQGDWGDVVEQDWRANDEAIVHGARLLSAYRDPNGIKYWVITEADRSVTTILLPDDY